MCTPTKPRLLLVGIDGADWLLTRHLLERGVLPNLADLIEHGAWGALHSTVPPTTPPAWTTIMTGKNPGKHGVFDFISMVDEGMGTPLAARRRATTLWRALSDGGLRVGTFNLPATWPPEPLSAFQVAGFDAPGFGPSLAYPEEAFAVLVDAVGEYELFPLSIQDPAGDRQALIRHADIPVLGTTALLRAFPCDVYMVSFQVVDWAHHGHLGREMTPLAPETLRTDGHVVEAYRLVDDRISALLSEWMGEDTTVIVLSDHGGAAADRLVNLESLFLQRGLLAYTARGGGGARSIESRRSRAARALGLWLGLKRALPAAARLLGPAARRLRGRLSSYQDEVAIDWSRTRAAPWGQYGQVRLNLAGRDPHGIVPPAEAAALARDIAELLACLRDPISGEAIYRAVHTNAELYDGPFAVEGPDLCAEPAQERYLTVSARSGVVELPLIDVQPESVMVLDPPWGTHSSVGIMLLAGAGVAAGAQLDGACVADLAPTALHLLGQPIPEDLDGRPLLDAVTVGEPSFRPPWPEPERATVAYSDHERGAVEQRLRDLGYL